MVPTARELGAALQRQRVELALSQQQLCERAGVARSWLSKLESGKHPRAEVQKVLDVVVALGLSVELMPAASVVPPDGDEENPFGDLFADRS